MMNMNEYPDGKLNQGDEGALKIATYIKDNRVVLDFGKDLSWIGFDKETLGRFIEGLKAKYDELC